MTNKDSCKSWAPTRRTSPRWRDLAMAEPVIDLEPESASPRPAASPPTVSPSRNPPYTTDNRNVGDEGDGEPGRAAATSHDELPRRKL